MFTMIGGHSVNPMNVFCIEPAEIEVIKTVVTSNNKEVEKSEIVKGVTITGFGGAAIEISGVTVEDVQAELNRALVSVYQPPE